MNRHPEVKREQEPPVELESQFILRLPQEPANVLREILRTGGHLKDRLTIKLENDIRYGEVRVDHWIMHAKLVDLPTIVESLKTIDNKSFYKTADLCQVKRLLRVDNDAVNVKWEVISEDDEKLKMGGVVVKQEPGLHMGVPGMGENSIDTSNQQSVDVAEHDIFGGAVSDSEEEETNINIMELEDETSRLSADDSRLSDSTSLQDSLERQHQALVTQFHRDMFSSRKALHSPGGGHIKQENTQSDFEGTSGVSHFGTGIKSEMSFDFDILKSELPSAHPDEAPTSPQFGDTGPPMSRGSIQSRLNELEQQLLELRHRRQQQELEIANIENYALRQRFQDILDHLLTEQMEKDQEYQQLTSLLQLG